MYKYLPDIVKSLKACKVEDLRIVKEMKKDQPLTTFDAVKFVKNAFDCTIKVNESLLIVRFTKDFSAEPPALDEYHKLNDLTVKTYLGKHAILYDEVTRRYRYMFAFSKETTNGDVEDMQAAIQNAFEKAEKGYDIITCPDMARSYRKLAEFIG